MTIRQSTLLGALVLMVPLAHAQLIEVQWSSDGRFERQVQIAPGKFVEVCDKLRPGSKVRWKFSGSAPTDFNIHYHEGKDVRFPAKEDSTSASQGMLDVTVGQDYCWMWKSKAAEAMSLNLELQKQ